MRGNTLNWIASFLQNRRQRVLLNGVFSDWSKVQSGVPQGTVLGPLLFLIYINDICEGLASNIRLFADECLLYRAIKSSIDVGHFQDDLNRLQAWCRTWQMNFNVKKCSIMHLSRRHQPITDKYSLNGTVLSTVSSHPYLGIEIQNDLRWNNHINNIVKKSSRSLRAHTSQLLSACLYSQKRQLLQHICLFCPSPTWGCFISFLGSVFDRLLSAGHGSTACCSLCFLWLSLHLLDQSPVSNSITASQSQWPVACLNHSEWI